MANRVFGWLKEAGKDVLKVVTYIPEAAITVERLLVDGQKLEPQAKQDILLLIADGEAVAANVTAASAAAGSNWLADAASVAAVEKLVQDFLKVLPNLELAAKTLAADVPTK